MALVAVCSDRFTLAPILARTWVTGDVKVGTVFPSPTVVTRAPEDESSKLRKWIQDRVEKGANK